MYTGALHTGTRLLLLLVLILQMSHTGLPMVSVHHTNDAGGTHCNCGCDCGDAPNAPDSCLNPVNHEGISCGCKKEHSRTLQPSAPKLCEAVLAHTFVFQPVLKVEKQLSYAHNIIVSTTVPCDPGPPF